MTKRLEPTPEGIAEAAALLRQGGLVAFPTETVYGLGADALNNAALRRVYEAKGRPSTNPLILHVDGPEMARDLTAGWPEEAHRLAERFWPGPLTIVLEARQGLQSLALAGGATVAVRAPAHPVALALLEAAGMALAAPSANPSGSLSPVAAEHVLAGLDGRIDAVLDGGPCAVGIESAVVDLSDGAAVLLRPGVVGRREIEECLGARITAPHLEVDDSVPLRAPGMMRRHYAPAVPLALVDDFRDEPAPPAGAARVWFGAPKVTGPLEFGTPVDPALYAARLYALLWECVARGAASILVERPPCGGVWEGVNDRLRRAAEP